MVIFRINDVDMSNACKSPKKATFIQVVGTLAATMGTLFRKYAKYSAKSEKTSFFCFGSSRARVGAPQEPTCSSGAGSVLLRSFCS